MATVVMGMGTAVLAASSGDIQAARSMVNTPITEQKRHLTM